MRVTRHQNVAGVVTCATQQQYTCNMTSMRNQCRYMLTLESNVQPVLMQVRVTRRQYAHNPELGM